jgi:hypothetical protein
MNYNKFKVGDLVRWNPNEYDILAGDKSDTGVVIEIGGLMRANEALS